MSKKNITSIIPIKDPNTTSLYELSKKIDSLSKCCGDMCNKICENEKIIYELNIRSNDQEKVICEQKNKINLLEEGLNKLNLIIM